MFWCRVFVEKSETKNVDETVSRLGIVLNDHRVAFLFTLCRIALTFHSDLALDDEDSVEFASVEFAFG